MRMPTQRHIFQSAFAAFIVSLVITATVTSGAAAGEDGIDPMGQLTSALGAVSDATDGVLNLSGYFNAHVMNHDGLPTFVNSRNLNKDFWQLREFSIFADVNVYEGIVVSSELELGDSFNSTTINYLYTQITFSDLLSNWDSDRFGSFSVRVGKILVPFLNYNENKPSFRQRLMSQPFTAWNLAPVIGTPLRKKGFGWSDYGALLDYKVFISAVGLVDFKLALIQGLQGGGQVLDSNFATLTAQVPGMNGALINPSIRPRDGLIQNENFSLGDNNGNLAKVLKFSYRPISLNLIVGASLYTGKWDDNAQFDITMYGFFGDYNSRNWGLKGEWGRADVEQASGVNPVPLPGPPPINLSVGNYSIKAWYLEAYRTLIRYGKAEEKQVNFIVRRDQVNTNSKVAFNPFDRSRWTVGSEWTFLKNIRARFEWQNSRIRDFKRAPGPFVASGGKKRVRMRMFSLIGYF